MGEIIWGAVLLIVLMKVIGLAGGSKKKDQVNELPEYGNTDESGGITVRVTLGDDDHGANNKTTGNWGQLVKKGKTPGVWVPLGSSAIINHRTVEGGGFYLGGKLDDLYGFSSDGALIDDSLEIVREEMHFEDTSLDYWPRFGALSPAGRGAFLSWLASDRTDPEVPLGYVFIYFYGLERRILIDAQKKSVSSQELTELRDEIVRLRSIYGSSRSFARYSSQLLSYLMVFHPATFPESDDLGLFEDSPMYFKYRLANLVRNGEPLSPEVAYAWVAFHSDYRLRMPARRCPQEYFKLFELEYREAFGDGLLVKENKAQFPRDFTPASPSLRGFELPRLDLRDPSRLTGPIKKLEKLADSATDQLTPFSKHVGSNGTHSNDLAGMVLLPPKLLQKLNPDVLKRFKKWAFDRCMNQAGVTSVQDLWENIGEPLPEKLLKRQQTLLQNLMDVSGFGMAPDQRYHYAKPELNGQVVLYPVGHDEAFKPSDHFFGALMSMRLGAMMAGADGSVDDSEVAFLESIVSNHRYLTPVETVSLKAYLKWLTMTPTSRVGLKASVESLSAADKANIRSHLVELVLADGVIHKDEIKQLEKLYKMLDIDSALATSDLHDAQTRTSDRVPRAALISPYSDLAKSPQIGGQMNTAMVDHHQQDTHEVQALLRSIFGEEFEEEASKVENKQQENDQGIDGVHFALFEELIGRESWPQEHLEDLCKQYGVMPSAAVETINDWTFEQVGAALLVEDGDLEVDQEIKEELVEMEI